MEKIRGYEIRKCSQRHMSAEEVTVPTVPTFSVLGRALCSERRCKFAFKSCTHALGPLP